MTVPILPQEIGDCPYFALQEIGDCPYFALGDCPYFALGDCPYFAPILPCLIQARAEAATTRNTKMKRLMAYSPFPAMRALSRNRAKDVENTNRPHRPCRFKGRTSDREFLRWAPPKESSRTQRQPLPEVGVDSQVFSPTRVQTRVCLSR